MIVGGPLNVIWEAPLTFLVSCRLEASEKSTKYALKQCGDMKTIEDVARNAFLCKCYFQKFSQKKCQHEHFYFRLTAGSRLRRRML